MRTCSKCGQTKPFSEFSYKNKAKGRYSYHCKGCSRLYISTHYKNNREYYLKKAYIRNRAVKKQVKEFVDNYLLHHPCVDCGEDDPVVLEFDHIRDKICEVSVLAQRHSLKKVVEEIAKCEIRCANCHRRKHFARVA